MDEKLALQAVKLLTGLESKSLDVLTLGRPHSVQYARELSLIVSKLSPIVANLLEFEFTDYLNANGEWPKDASWERQDPDFPDLSLREGDKQIAGIEVKAWFPLSTEITGRFRESSAQLKDSEIRVMVVAWLPEFLVHGSPKIIDTWVDKASHVAKSRDEHYHKPPWYLVVEPEDTRNRTRNLRQTNCEGHVFQDSQVALNDAGKEVAAWPAGEDHTSEAYQRRLRDLMGRYKYRLDTNFSKIDRIEHAPLEKFKRKVLATKVHGRTIDDWASLLGKEDRTALEQVTRLGGPKTGQAWGQF